MRLTAERSDQAASADRALEPSVDHGGGRHGARIACIPADNALAAGRRLAGKDPG